MKKRHMAAIGLGVVVGALYINNASWIAGAPEGNMTLLSHRGVHQTFHTDNLTNDTCTAERIDTPSHNYIENTLSAFEAAINAGAQMIELDIHPTTDGEFAVFHDWTVDCRTDGSGKTREHEFAELKALDIGYGYTADDGKSFPFRGEFVGQMPSLGEVLDAFPDTHFMINIKSRSRPEAKALLEYLEPDDWERLSVVGHTDPITIIAEAKPKIAAVTKPAAKACLKSYVLTGWTGNVPEACYETIVPVPLNYRRLMWGWPHRFEQRLNAVGSRSMLIGPLENGRSGGVDTAKHMGAVPKSYKGIVFTDKIEVVGPELRPEFKPETERQLMTDDQSSG